MSPTSPHPPDITVRNRHFAKRPLQTATQRLHSSGGIKARPTLQKPHRTQGWRSKPRLCLQPRHDHQELPFLPGTGDPCPVKGIRIINVYPRNSHSGVPESKRHISATIAGTFQSTKSFFDFTSLGAFPIMLFLRLNQQAVLLTLTPLLRLNQHSVHFPLALFLHTYQQLVLFPLALLLHFYQRLVNITQMSHY